MERSTKNWNNLINKITKSPFELFIQSSKITDCNYSEHRKL